MSLRVVVNGHARLWIGFFLLKNGKVRYRVSVNNRDPVRFPRYEWWEARVPMPKPLRPVLLATLATLQEEVKP